MSYRPVKSAFSQGLLTFTIHLRRIVKFEVCRARSPHYQAGTILPARDRHHQMTSCLVNKHQSLVIEDLNVRGMMAGWTPKAQADAGMGEIRRQLIYKGEWYHCQLLLADLCYPSSKTCSVCGVVNAEIKRERRWWCGSCGTTHERNQNAAVNLRNLLTLPSGRGVNIRNGKALAAGSTCRETGPDDRRTAPSEPSSATL